MPAFIARSQDRLPFGTGDLWHSPSMISDRPRRVRCYVLGCPNILETPTRGGRGDVCPEHGIRCHFSAAGATYSYRDPRRNMIASPQLFADRIINHPFKFESHRMGLEKSEDAVSWNVFRSLAESNGLAKIASLITGLPNDEEPALYLWGIRISGDDFTPWDLLIEARKRFENNLPVDRPLTEPDIALHLPGKYLILVEAKFTSPNSFYERGPRQNRSSLTLDELLGIYHDRRLAILSIERARSALRVPYQLWRNMVFAEWMATLDSPTTRAYHVNLVREGYEAKTELEFRELVRPECQDRFHRLTWEGIYAASIGPQHRQLRQYIETKTAGLKQAFAV
jgi:hypothetical protein